MEATVSDFKRAYSLAEFCRRSGISRSTTYEQIKAEHLQAVKAGNRTLVRVDDAESWLQSLPKSQKRRRQSDLDSNPFSDDGPSWCQDLFVVDTSPGVHKKAAAAPLVARVRSDHGFGRLLPITKNENSTMVSYEH